MRCSSCRAVVDVDVIFVAVVVNVLVGCEAVFLRQKVTLYSESFTYDSQIC